MSLTEKQKLDQLTELLDPQRVTLWCKDHNYVGPVKGRPEMKPAIGCANCWKVFFMSELATTPPSERRQKLEELEEVLANVVQLVESGKWDFEPYSHARIQIGTE